MKGRGFILWLKSLRVKCFSSDLHLCNGHVKSHFEEQPQQREPQHDIRKELWLKVQIVGWNTLPSSHCVRTYAPLALEDVALELIT